MVQLILHSYEICGKLTYFIETRCLSMTESYGVCIMYIVWVVIIVFYSEMIKLYCSQITRDLLILDERYEPFASSIVSYSPCY